MASSRRDLRVSYWHVDDVAASVKQLLESGAETHREVEDVGGGKLIASVKDGDGNIIALVQSS